MTLRPLTKIDMQQYVFFVSRQGSHIEHMIITEKHADLTKNVKNGISDAILRLKLATLMPDCRI